MLIPKGYTFGTAAAAFKKAGRDDLAVVVSDTPAACAGVFTTNRFKAAPVLVAREMIAAGDSARAVVINSGQANACTGDEGMANCKASLEMVGEALGLEPGDILPASTGVIGAQFDMDRWKAAMPALARSLGKKTPEDMAKAIMTTDTVHKLAGATVMVGGQEVRVMGFCKGAGMICPTMATMLGCVLTDADVDFQRWRGIIKTAVDTSFNRVTVDGDTSTNDTVFGLANGASGVVVRDEDEAALQDTVTEVCMALAYMIVQDAEGGTKVCCIRVTQAADAAQAELAARAVGNSPLVKTALFGKDANWGRIACALGYSGAQFKAEDVNISMGGIRIFQQGQPVDMDIDAALKTHLNQRDILIEVELGAGDGQYELLASDLTHEYVSINADYRS